ncbi:MAG: hypothetical protein H6571_09795 [Lewinellaceae bacterium]|nr:hypothetical protein [Lewinellaceae bacterium]
MIQENYEKELKKAFFYACQYGAETYLAKFPNDGPFNKYEFLKSCYAGFKEAQNMILKELKKNQIHLKKMKNALKKVRGLVDKEKEKEIKNEIEEINYQNDLFRNLAFSMAWQMLGGKREILARFYTEDAGEKELSGIGFDAIIAEARKINSYPTQFGLILDLTSNLQIGDLLVVSGKNIQVIEVKTGKKNDEAKRIIKFYEVNQMKVTQETIQGKYDENFSKQLLRVVEQNKRRERLINLHSKDQGKDPKHDNVDVNLPNSIYPEEKYHDIILELIQKSKTETFAYTIIENIVNIGVYRDNMRFWGPNALKALNKNFPVHDIMSARGITISEPVFLKPFPEEDIFDIVFDRVKIYIGIDYDEFILLCKNLGLPADWSSKKELSQLLQSLPFKSKEVFSFDNRGIKIEDKSIKSDKLFLGMGLFGRIIFDQIRPSSIIINRKAFFDKI